MNPDILRMLKSGRVLRCSSTLSALPGGTCEPQMYIYALASPATRAWSRHHWPFSQRVFAARRSIYY